MIVIGVIIIIGTVIGSRIIVFIPKENRERVIKSSRIVVFIPKENRERVIKGSVILLIGAVVLVSFITFRIIKPDPFKEFFFLYIDASIIGIAFILTGIFTIRPMQSRNGKTILGITSIIFGVIIIIVPLFHISIWANAWYAPLWGAIAMSSPLWLVGIIFFIHGTSLFIKAGSMN